MCSILEGLEGTHGWITHGDFDANLTNIFDYYKAMVCNLKYFYGLGTGTGYDSILAIWDHRKAIRLPVLLTCLLQFELNPQYILWSPVSCQEWFLGV